MKKTYLHVTWLANVFTRFGAFRIAFRFFFLVTNLILSPLSSYTFVFFFFKINVRTCVLLDVDEWKIRRKEMNTHFSFVPFFIYSFPLDFYEFFGQSSMSLVILFLTFFCNFFTGITHLSLPFIFYLFFFKNIFISTFLLYVTLVQCCFN